MAKGEDLTGQVFGELTVIKLSSERKQDHRAWDCKCSCGNYKLARAIELKRGRLKTCGDQYKHFKGINRIGLKYGRLKVIDFAVMPTTRHSREKNWLCRCECGNEIIVGGGRLASGNTKSCGCLAKEYFARGSKCWLNPESASTSVFCAYKRNARNKNREFLLTKEEVKDIILKSCHYCGSEGMNTIRTQNGEFHYNGIDRVDSSQGYFRENVVPCCPRCNYAKLDYSLEEFKDWLKVVYERMHKE